MWIVCYASESLELLKSCQRIFWKNIYTLYIRIMSPNSISAFGFNNMLGSKRLDFVLICGNTCYTEHVFI